MSKKNISLLKLIADTIGYMGLTYKSEIIVCKGDYLTIAVPECCDSSYTGTKMTVEELEENLSSYSEDGFGGYSREIYEYTADLEDAGVVSLY